MNTNFAHNLLNIGIAAATAALVASGCAAVAGALDCSRSWIDPEITAYAIGAMSVAKIVMNIFRDGITGLWKPQPPVEK